VIDAFRRGPPGCYDDGVVVVERVPGAAMTLELAAGRPWLRHSLAPGDVDNDLAGVLTGVGIAAEHFERLFTGVVVTSAVDALAGWAAFYTATLARLTGSAPGAGSIGEFAPIYRRARALVRGRRVLDVASCFGFLPILLTDDGYDVVASDVNAGSMTLLSRVEPGLPVLCCGADALPFPDRSMDTVLAVHLLEHVDVTVGKAALTEALRVADRRVVVAVPYEKVPDPAYGHVRTVTRDDLVTYGEATGWPFDVLDADGGWLILDRP